MRTCKTESAKVANRQVLSATVGDTITIRVLELPRGHGQKVILEVVAESGEKPAAVERGTAG